MRRVGYGAICFPAPSEKPGSPTRNLAAGNPLGENTQLQHAPAARRLWQSRAQLGVVLREFRRRGGGIRHRTRIGRGIKISRPPCRLSARSWFRSPATPLRSQDRTSHATKTTAPAPKSLHIDSGPRRHAPFARTKAIFKRARSAAYAGCAEYIIEGRALKPANQAVVAACRSRHFRSGNRRSR